MKKRIIFIILFLIIIGLLSAFILTTLDDDNYVTLSIKDITKEGATIIIKDTFGAGFHVYGEAFEIEKKIDDGWVKLEHSDNYAFDLKAYYVNDKGILEMNLNWKDIYGTLDEGIYRIIMTYFENAKTPIKEEDHKYLLSEFYIE